MTVFWDTFSKYPGIVLFIGRVLQQVRGTKAPSSALLVYGKEDNEYSCHVSRYMTNSSLFASRELSVISSTLPGKMVSIPLFISYISYINDIISQTCPKWLLFSISSHEACCICRELLDYIIAVTAMHWRSWLNGCFYFWGQWRGKFATHPVYL